EPLQRETYAGRGVARAEDGSGGGQQQLVAPEPVAERLHEKEEAEKQRQEPHGFLRDRPPRAPRIERPLEPEHRARHERREHDEGHRRNRNASVRRQREEIEADVIREERVDYSVGPTSYPQQIGLPTRSLG